MKSPTPELYDKYFVVNGEQRLELFRVLSNQFQIKKVLYPGSFVHLTPSFLFPAVAYVDSDKRCNRFFNDAKTIAFIEKNKEYSDPQEIRFHFADFSNGFPEKEKSFDLLISLYAGFVSKYCKKYLKKGGTLLANNSHGDSSLAYLDSSYKFIGVVKRRGERFNYSEKNTDDYFITKTGKPIDKKVIEKSMKGAGFTKTAYAYVFKKTR